MKHRLFAVILLICLVLLLSACAGTGSPDVTPEPEPTADLPEPSPAPVDLYDPEPGSTPSTQMTDALSEFTGVSAKQTANMSIWGEYGFGVIENNIYYGRFFLKGDPAPMLFSIKLSSDKYDVKAGSRKILDSEHSPKYIIKEGNVLFYIMLDRNTGESLGIAKTDTDGNGFQVLYNGDCSYLSKAGELLYFTDSTGRPASVDTEGGDLRIISDRMVYYLYALSEDWLIFQDDADNESLHLFRISDGTDIKLNDEPSYYPLINGTSLFFSIPDNETAGAFRLACIDMSSYTERYDEEQKCFIPVFSVQYGSKLFGGEYYLFNGTIFFMNGSAPEKSENWQTLEDDAYTGFKRIVRFVSDNWMIEEITGKDGGISAIMFHNRKGAIASKIPWLS